MSVFRVTRTTTETFDVHAETETEARLLSVSSGLNNQVVPVSFAVTTTATPREGS